MEPPPTTRTAFFPFPFSLPFFLSFFFDVILAHVQKHGRAREHHPARPAPCVAEHCCACDNGSKSLARVHPVSRHPQQQQQQWDPLDAGQDALADTREHCRRAAPGKERRDADFYQQRVCSNVVTFIFVGVLLAIGSCGARIIVVIVLIIHNSSTGDRGGRGARGAV